MKIEKRHHSDSGKTFWMFVQENGSDADRLKAMQEGFALTLWKLTP